MDTDKKLKKIIKVQSIIRVWLAKRTVTKRYAVERERRKLVKELLDTEVQYVHVLRILVENFEKPLMRSARSDKPVITYDKVATLFGNINDLLEFQVTFVARLRDAVQNYWTIPLSMVFMEMFDVNSPAHSTLNALMTKPKFVTFTEDLFKQVKSDSQHVRFLHLPSWLMQPVQRVPRYTLLLKAILKVTDPSHVDFAGLTKALQHMEQVSKEINNGMETPPKGEDSNRKRASTMNKNTLPKPVTLSRDRSTSISSQKLEAPNKTAPLKMPARSGSLTDFSHAPSRSSMPNFMKHTASSLMKVKPSVGKEQASPGSQKIISELDPKGFSSFIAQSFMKSPSKTNISSMSAPVSPLGSRKTSMAKLPKYPPNELNTS